MGLGLFKGNFVKGLQCRRAEQLHRLVAGAVAGAVFGVEAKCQRWAV